MVEQCAAELQRTKVQVPFKPGIFQVFLITAEVTPTPYNSKFPRSNIQDISYIFYRSKLFLGYSIFKLVFFFFKPGQFVSTLVNFFQTRSTCFNLGQLVST